MNFITPTWFEKVYAEADEASAIPWANLRPSPDLVAWLDTHQVKGRGRKALVVGCGLGDDAEELNRRGFLVTAFDVAPTAVKMCRERFPQSAVNYQVADLFDPPPGWYEAFDFVLEYFNIQSLSPTVHQQAMAAISRLAAVGGTVLIINLGCDRRENLSGPPWPLLKKELQIFEEAGLQLINLEEYDPQPGSGICRLRLEYQAVTPGVVTVSTSPSAYHPAEVEIAFAAFQADYPNYSVTQVLDNLREQEYSRLEAHDHVYLDYTGGGMFADCQLREHWALLNNNVYGNPHSHNMASAASTTLVEQTRAHVADFFKASAAEYSVIFTPNATGALRLVGESYPFNGNSRYALIYDNHNSVNGIREFARLKGAAIHYVLLNQPAMQINEAALWRTLAQADVSQNNLFAYPAQSNFSGVQHTLEWISAAQSRGWDVLLDASAFVPTNVLDLSRWQPDFVSISFYKMFGYPTGIGCLIARKAALAKLRRPWFAGGTIVLSSVLADNYHLADNEAAFEDGTVDYLGIPAIEVGLRHLSSIGLQTIRERVRSLTGWLLSQLQGLQHSNGRPLAVIYGPTDTQMRGGTIAFNLYDKNGKLFDYRRVEELANQARISIRTGCFCNPGSAETCGGLTKEEMAPAFVDGVRLTHREFVTILRQEHDKNTGAVRISVGLVSNFVDVYRFMNFIHNFCDQTVEEVGEVLIESINCRIISKPADV